MLGPRENNIYCEYSKEAEKIGFGIYYNSGLMLWIVYENISRI
jgi:hypothetical protein